MGLATNKSFDLKKIYEPYDGKINSIGHSTFTDSLKPLPLMEALIESGGFKRPWLSQVPKVFNHIQNIGNKLETQNFAKFVDKYSGTVIKDVTSKTNIPHLVETRDFFKEVSRFGNPESILVNALGVAYGAAFRAINDAGKYDFAQIRNAAMIIKITLLQMEAVNKEQKEMALKIFNLTFGLVTSFISIPNPALAVIANALMSTAQDQIGKLIGEQWKDKTLALGDRFRDLFLVNLQAIFVENKEYRKLIMRQRGIIDEGIFREKVENLNQSFLTGYNISR